MAIISKISALFKRKAVVQNLPFQHYNVRGRIRLSKLKAGDIVITKKDGRLGLAVYERNAEESKHLVISVTFQILSEYIDAGEIVGYISFDREVEGNELYLAIMLAQYSYTMLPKVNERLVYKAYVEALRSAK